MYSERNVGEPIFLRCPLPGGCVAWKSCKTELPSSVQAGIFLLFLLDDWVFRLIKKLIPEATVLPVGTRIDKRSNTANWNCHGAGKPGAGICYDYSKPLRLLGCCWVWAEEQLWSAQVSNLVFKQSFILVGEGWLRVSLQQRSYASCRHTSLHLWRVPFFMVKWKMVLL